MSAIYGAINLSGGQLPKDIAERLKKEYVEKNCKIDRYEEINTQNLFMGCGIQYFTQTAVNERLPLFDSAKGLYFDADAVVDNRSELIEKLSKKTDSDISDGEILCKAYQKWGVEFPLYVRGVFSAVVYDEKKKILRLYSDQFASRCLYYYIAQDIVYYSTLFDPLLSVIDEKLQMNERWLLDEITVRGPVMALEPKETAIVGICKLVAGTYLEIDLSNIAEGGAECRYWNPTVIPENKTIDYKKSEEMVRDVFTKAVEQCMHCAGPVSIQLSGGLDSTAVGGIAAGILAKKNEKLYSFTSVPDKEANLKNSSLHSYDETEGVLELCKAYPNIEPEFVDTKGRNYLAEAQAIIDIWELPCKSEQNAIWVDEIFRKASVLGSKVMLNGSTGNCTLSAGNFSSAVYSYIKSFRLKKAYNLLRMVSRVGGSRKAFIKDNVSRWLNYYLWYLGKDKEDIYENTFTRIDKGDEYKVNKRLLKEVKHTFPFISKKEHRRQIYLINAYNQIGQVETKLSLQYGVLSRDPMRNVEVIELCYAIPKECYVGDDYDRRLIRESMSGIVPDKIRHNIVNRGVQSGDNEYRIDEIFLEKAGDIEAVLLSETVTRYLDTTKIKEAMALVKEKGAAECISQARMIVDAYSFGLFITKIAKNY